MSCSARKSLDNQQPTSYTLPHQKQERNIMSEQTTLTISQALRYAAKLKNQISDARTRAQSSLTHKSDQQTAFNFQDMLDKSFELGYKLAELQGKLAEVNANNTVKYLGVDVSLAHAVRILQEIKGQIAWIKALPSLQTQITKTQDRVWNDEKDEYVSVTVQMLCYLPEADKADLVDNLQDKFDVLNSAVEHANQTVSFTF